MSYLLPNVLVFGRVLRRAGLEVHHGRLLDAIRSLDWIGIRRRDDVRATLRALLVHRHDDLARFDTLFDAFFRSHDVSSTNLELSSLGERPRVVARPVAGPPSVDLEGAAADSDEPDDADPRRLQRVGGVANEGLRRIQRGGARAGAPPAPRAAVGAGHLERRGAGDGAPAGPWISGPILRRSLTRGEVLELPRRRRRRSPRPIVVIGDVSGSMERYSRMILHFAEGLSIGARQVESFVFARVTRITRSLTTRRSAQQLARVIRDITDWGGGTRIGEALAPSTPTGRGGSCGTVRWSSWCRTAGIAAIQSSWRRSSPGFAAVAGD